MKPSLPRLSVIAFALGFLSVSSAQEIVPGESWMQYADLEAAGWSEAALAEAREYWESLDSAAWMVVENGVVVVAWGDVERRYMCHSVRKSLLSGLYGLHVDAGTIDTEKTLAELGIDDEPPLTDEEKTARVEDLLCARSGVYRPAAYEPDDQAKPERGSHPPGTNWVYNNWDFNTLCTIFEEETGEKVFEEFERGFARPLDMQDYRVRDGYYHYELDKSIHPAYPFRLSARDSARFGLLYLYEGQWGDERVLSKEYVEESTRSYTKRNEGGGGYGYMWWTYGEPEGMYSAQGVGGQTIAVLPEQDLVIVNRTNTYLGKSVPGNRRFPLIHMIVQAKTGAAEDEPELVPMKGDVGEEVRVRAAEPSSAEELARYVGAYELTVASPIPIEISVSLEGDTLLFESSFAGVFALIPIEEDVFLCEDILSYLRFDKPAVGETGTLMWEWALLREFGDRADADDVEGAMAVAERCLELFPMSSLAHYVMAAVLAETGDPALAIELCEAAMELGPEAGEARALHALLTAD